MTETDVQNLIRLRLGTRPDLRLWRNNVGVFQTLGMSPRKVRCGLCEGSSDLIGVLQPGGRFVALEVKMPGKKRSPAQEAWQKGVRDMGGFACVVHSADEAEEAIERAKQGLSE